MAVHLAQWHDLHAGLSHFEDEVRQALVLRQLDIRARQKQSVVRTVRTRGPDLLSIDHPAVTAPFRLGHGTGKIGAAAGLAEELTPRILARQDAAQELLFVKIGAMRKNGCG